MKTRIESRERKSSKSRTQPSGLFAASLRDLFVARQLAERRAEEIIYFRYARRPAASMRRRGHAPPLRVEYIYIHAHEQRRRARVTSTVMRGDGLDGITVLP
ncbi:hypothetical protein EVAR_33450_1 [Eumeta japonica]|uniref:Uncharacterized protein n=1 Tax=Eumeta variegata TaxID=151549 RepID=A0A4C1WE82_EUMVA|nr:hypothetical protein EVAR_33450_1 [Eumeta japonica]